ATHTFGKDRAVTSRDGDAVAVDGDDLPGLAAARHLGAVKDVDLLSLDRAPGAGRRVGRADEIVDIRRRLGPIDLGYILLEPAFVSLLGVVLRNLGRLAGAHQVDGFHHRLDA